MLTKDHGLFILDKPVDSITLEANFNKAEQLGLSTGEVCSKCLSASLDALLICLDGAGNGRLFR